MPEQGTARVEKKIIDHKDQDISDDHLIAYRMSKEEILHNWLRFLKEVIKTYFANLGKIVDEEVLFQTQFDEQLWKNIETFVNNLKQLPLWKDRSMASTVFSGKKNYDYWRVIFETGEGRKTGLVRLLRDRHPNFSISVPHSGQRAGGSGSERRGRAS